ncbi:MAG: substrate-binding domain-containing protein [Verrucomicrobiota bacterium]
MRLLTVCSLLILASAAVVSCSKEDLPLQIDGSTGVWPLVAPLVEAYQREYPGRAIGLEKGLGPTARLQALAEGKIDIAMASHGVDPEELKGNGRVPHRFSQMAVVFAVHDSVSVRNLTSEQVCGIYRGDVRNWNELGGPDLAIVRLMRPETEVDTEVIRAEMPEMTDLQFAADTQIKQSSGDLAKALDATEGAIGITTVGRVLRGEHTEALKLDGIRGGEESVKARTYPLSRNCYLVTSGEPSERVQHFLDFVGSERAADLIRASGGIPE